MSEPTRLDAIKKDLHEDKVALMAEIHKKMEERVQVLQEENERLKAENQRLRNMLEVIANT